MKLTRRTSSHFRQTDQGMVLIATRSESHPELQFPPSEYIHGDAAPHDVAIGPNGRLYTYTVVHPGKEASPYALAMVDFEPGVRVFGRLVHNTANPPVIGGTVRVVPFELPDGNPDYAFEPLQGSQ